MQQFRPLSSFETDVADVDFPAESSQPAGYPQGVWMAGRPQGVPLHLLERRTDELAVIPDQFSQEPGAISLITALQSTMSTNTSGRIVVIPGARKRKRTAHASPGRRLNRRLRNGLIYGAILLVLVTTLLSLSPLASGQGGFAVLAAFGNWVRQAGISWEIQSHDMQVSQQPVETNNPAPPPMTLPKSQYIAIAQQDAMAAGISPDYFVRQINQESGFNPNAVSSAGAIGIAQFEPGTAAGLGINPWDPIQSLRAAAQLMASYARNYGGDYAKALAAYNGGPGTVTYAVNACGAAYWLNCLPGQTRHYIYVIMGI